MKTKSLKALKLLPAIALIGFCCTSMRAQGFDFALEWDNPPATNLVDVITTNVTTWACITGMVVWRTESFDLATNGVYKATNFVRLLSASYITNRVMLSNQPLHMAFYYVTFTGPFGETLPSNTNQVFPPMPAPLPTGMRGKRPVP